MAYRSMTMKSDNPNLCFRRWLCFEQNLAAGLAQNVVRLGEVTRWNIRNHVLVAGNRSGRLLIRRLRQSPEGAPVTSRQLSLINLLWSRRLTEIELIGCFATANGDAIVNFDAVNAAAEDKGYVARVTAKGNFIWFIANDWSCLSVGVEHVYVLQWNLLLTDSCKIATLDIRNGKTIFTTTIPYLKHAAEGSLGRFKMILSNGERFISITNRNEVLGIYDTAARRLVDIEEPFPLNYAARAGTWVSADPEGHGFDELYRRDKESVALYQYLYDAATMKFSRTLSRDVSGDSLAPQGGLDAHRGLIFEIVNNFVIATCERFCVRPLHDLKCNKLSWRPLIYQKFLTVPNKDTGERRPVEFPGRKRCQEHQKFAATTALDEIYWADEENCYGIQADYLVYHIVSEGALVVLDFWPEWGNYQSPVNSE